MPRQRLNSARQVSLFLLGVILLIPPFLMIFDRPGRLAGIPLLYLYLFTAWAFLIALTGRLATSLDREAEGGRLPTDRGGDADARSERLEHGQDA